MSDFGKTGFWDSNSRSTLMQVASTPRKLSMNLAEYPVYEQLSFPNCASRARSGHSEHGQYADWLFKVPMKRPPIPPASTNAGDAGGATPGGCEPHTAN
jgi:hypothetical protein